MEVLEILVYFGIAILVGGLVLGFISSWDYKQGYDDMKHLMMPKENLEYERLSQDQFAGKIHKFFDKCYTTGFNLSMTLYVEDSGNLTKSSLFDIYKELGWCDTIQSAANDCGHREDIIMGNINIPKVIRVNCTNSTLYLT